MFLPSDITLQFGDSGDFVAEMQRRLVAVSAGGPNLVTGQFDGMTVNAVSSFQARCGIRADGIAGPDTLRRLNAVYSGDPITSEDTDSKKEEEEAALAAASLQHQVFVAQDAMAMSPVAMPGAELAVEAVREPQPQLAALTELPPLAPLKSDADLQLQLQQQIQRDSAQLAALQAAQPLQAAPATPTPSDLLAQMLLSQTPPAPLATTPEAATQRAPLETRPPLAAAALEARPPLAAASTDVAQQATPVTDPNTQNPERATTVLTREQAPSLVQRGVQMANAMLQKLASYFEEKLPDSVLKQVQDAGKIMAQNGVKEVAIPAGPELAARGPELPTRGPEQPQVQQRG